MSATSSSNQGEWSYLRRLLITLAVIALAYAAWQIAGVLLLLFASILISVLIAGLAGLLEQHAPIGYRWTLTAVVVGLLLILGGFFVFFGAQLAGQIGQVFSRVPSAVNAAGGQLGIDDAYSRLSEAVSSRASGQLLSGAAQMGYTLIGILADLVLVVIAAVYLAADPLIYRDGVLKLFPPGQHERLCHALSTTASALRLWFIGQLGSMVLVGILSATAFWLIGVPSAIGLGVIAGLTNFIPIVGPILGAVPAVLFAFTQGPNAVLWTVLAIVAIQQVEGNLIMPLVQRRAVEVPPAVILFAIAAFGVLFGWLGIIFAVPLAVTAMVLVQKLWVRDTLGERTHIAGEKRMSA
jgi:predicted PurR-regulated permease PerM